MRRLLLILSICMMLIPATTSAQDSDRDGVADLVDNCPNYYNPNQLDIDEDGIGNVCDSCSDSDGDGYGHPAYLLIDCLPDNCPCEYNPDQADSNADGIGDACEPWLCGDLDFDGIPGEWHHDVLALFAFFDHTYSAPCLDRICDVDGCLGLDIGDLGHFQCWATPGCNPGDLDCDSQSCTTLIGEDSISVSSIEGLALPDTALVGTSAVFHLKCIATDKVYSQFNAFQVTGSEGLNWSWVEATMSSQLTAYTEIAMTYGRGLSGRGADTVVLFASNFLSDYFGLPAGFNDSLMTIEVGPLSLDDGPGQLCLDSCSVPPHGSWMWAVGSGGDLDRSVPSWSGPHCITVIRCCDPRGDIDNNGSAPDIADLVYLVSYMFQDGPEPVCPEKADINGDSIGPDIADLVYLVTFMFQDGPPPAPCE